MRELLEFLNQNYPVKAFGLSLLHSLWQGVLIAAVLWLLLKIAGNGSARMRYRMAFIALFSLFLCFVCTLYIQLNTLPPDIGASETGYALPLLSVDAAGEAVAEESLVQKVAEYWNMLLHWLHQHITYFFLSWATGFFLFSFRFFTGLFYLRNLRQEATPLPAGWLQKVQALKQQLGLHKEIKLVASVKVNTPLTFGWLKPVIVLPLSIVSLLPEEQVESILLHELAHIRRNDYLVNLLQSIMEVTFFFNPAYWYLSKVLELEREHVCDDLVLANSANAHTYALALTRLAELSSLGGPGLAMAAAHKKGNLIFRIKRIIHPQKSYSMEKSIRRKSYQLASLIVVCTMLFFVTIDATGTSGNAKHAEGEEGPAAAADSGISIEGAVLSKHGGTLLPGVAVFVKGSNNGTTTDIAGNYSIRAKADDILVFSFVGFHKKEIPVNQKNFHMIVLESIEKVENSRLVINDVTVTQHEDGKEQANTKVKDRLVEAKVPDSRVILLYEDEDIKAEDIKKLMKYITTEELKWKDIGHRGREITAVEFEAMDKSLFKSNLTLSSEETGHKRAVILVELKEAEEKVAVVSTKPANTKPLFVLLVKEIVSSVKGESLDYKAALAQGRVVSDVSEIDPANIASMHILKNEEAVAAAGEAGKNGVIFISLKKSEEKQANELAGEVKEEFTVYPNPTDEVVKVRFYNATKQPVKMDVLDTKGNKIHTFVDGVLDKGLYQYEWNAADQRAGTYSIMLRKGKEVKTTKLALE